LNTDDLGFKQFIGSMFERLDRTASILVVVFVGAFLETTVLPIPFELLLVPLMLRHRRLLWMIVLAALAGCMTGALAGYTIGLYAYQSFGVPVVQWLGAEQAMSIFKGRLEKNAFMSVFLVGFTPIPIQVATLGAGFTQMALMTFSMAVLLSRALRFGGLGLLVHWFGEDTLQLLQRHRYSALALGLLLLALLIFLLTKA